MIIFPKHTTPQHPIITLDNLGATTDLQLFTTTDVSNFIDVSDSLSLLFTNVVPGTKLNVQIELLRILPPLP